MRVYLDHNATTPMRPEVRALQEELYAQDLANASSLHASGRRARDVVDLARERTARALGVEESEVLFTSGGTESNNLALHGVVRARGPEAGLITTTIEHSSVLGVAEALEEEGRSVHRIPVDADGRVRLDALEVALTDERVAVCSVQAANNEVGVLGPLVEARELVDAVPSERRPVLHTDAVQALGRVPLQLDRVDLASFSAHKVGGPTGVGVLVRRGGVGLRPLARGGEQETGLRPGTENVIGIACAALAIELAVEEAEAFRTRTLELAQTLWGELASRLPSLRLLGPGLEEADRLPNTLNVLMEGGGVDGRVLVTRLDLEGLEVSAGSACASGSLEPSHVLRAMQLDDEAARAGLRVSFGRTTTREECTHAVDVLVKVFSSARAT